ncbi:MAG TPA: hypothetical protein VFT72_20465 [Opitutaceae bacterium]|nr:hypothetical protein [Opitutaceae bacterium]
MKLPRPSASLFFAVMLAVPLLARAQTPEVPDWAQPGSATHKQVPPPKDFHRATRTTEEAIGVFSGQSDIGGAVVKGSSRFDAKTGAYTIDSAGYNIWYTRDEFRYLWKKVSGDVSLAADIRFPNPEGYFDRKVVFVIRQDLDDDSKEVMTALHGGGLIHIADRPEKGAEIKEAFRIEAPASNKASPGMRLGIEKHGDEFTLFVGEPGQLLKQKGPAVTLKFDQPFYVGIGFTSHLPATSDTVVVSNVILENAPGKLK